MMNKSKLKFKFIKAVIRSIWERLFPHRQTVIAGTIVLEGPLVIRQASTLDVVAMIDPSKFGLLGESVVRAAVSMTLFSINLGEVRETFRIMRRASSKEQLQNRLAARVSKFTWQ